MACKVREALQPLINNRPGIQERVPLSMVLEQLVTVGIPVNCPLVTVVDREVMSKKYAEIHQFTLMVFSSQETKVDL